VSENNRFELNRALEPLENPPTFRFGTWDVEATDWWNLLVIGVFDGDHYYHFRNVGDFLDHILSDRYRAFRWFAHFGGRYDLNFVFDFIRTRNDCDVTFHCSGSMVIQMKIRRGAVTATLCDSYRLLQASLRDLTKAFNVKHAKTEIDFHTMTYSRELLEYNEQDCRGLYEVLDAFFEETGLRSETFATHALRLWRKDFLKENIWKPRQEILDFIRTGYHGGRVEVFRRQADHCYAYDVNSMYPYVMLQPMPVEYVGESTQLTDSYFGFLECSVKLPDSRFYIPPLPMRLEKLFFPTGTLRAVWSSEELIEAENRGAQIQTIHKGYYFKVRDIFKGYIEKLYALKQKASEPTRTIAKLLMNALYGKFGQNPKKKVYMTERNAPDGSIPILNPDGRPSGFAYFERVSRQSYLLPHLAAAVTSKARIHLMRKLTDTTYYCDTDSVFTSESMETSKRLGEWSMVGEGNVRFIQPKLYKFNGTWKAKGLNREESIDAFVDGSPNHVMRSKSIKEALNDGSAACQSVHVEKLLRETRPKRAWVGDDTRPWDIKELL